MRGELPISGLRCASGIALLTLLIYLSIMASGLLAAVTLWSEEARRVKEAKLLHVGAEIRRAIGTYYEHTPGTVHRYPATLEDLLEDKRYLTLVRYLRRVYPDPLTLKPKWGLVRAPDGGVMGVYSLSDREPLKKATFPTPFEQFAGSKRYSDWHFVYLPTGTPHAPGHGP